MQLRNFKWVLTVLVIGHYRYISLLSVDRSHQDSNSVTLFKWSCIFENGFLTGYQNAPHCILLLNHVMSDWRRAKKFFFFPTSF